MTVAELITAAIQHHLAIGQADASDADYRARCLLHLKRRAKKRWFARHWWFRYGTANVTVDNTGKGPLPSNFSSFGKEGFAQVSGQRRPMTWVSPRVLYEIRLQSTGTQKIPTIYTLADSDGASTRYLQTGPRPHSGNVTVAIRYDKVCPTLTDVATEIPEFPADYHETVLLDDVIALLMSDEGDLRSAERQKAADDADRDFWRESIQGRHQARRSPRYGQKYGMGATR